MTGRKVAQLLQERRDAVLPDNIIPAVPLPPPAPERSGRTRNSSGRASPTACRMHPGIGLPYDQVPSRPRCAATPARSTTCIRGAAWPTSSRPPASRSWPTSATAPKTGASLRDGRGQPDDLDCRQQPGPAHHPPDAQPQHHGHGFFSCVAGAARSPGTPAARQTRPPVDGERNWSGISWTPCVEEGSLPPPLRAGPGRHRLVAEHAAARTGAGHGAGGNRRAGRPVDLPPAPDG